MTQDEKAERLNRIRQHKELLKERYKLCPEHLKSDHFLVMTALVEREHKIMAEKVVEV